jgi:hypothetical protein
MPVMPTILPTPPGPDKRKLLDQVRDVMRFKHYSLRTERTYTDWIRSLYGLLATRFGAGLLTSS